MDALIQKIKDLQRKDPEAKKQWWSYCAAEGGNIRDPAKHNEAFLGEFITNFESGMRIELPEDSFSDKEKIAELIKLGNRKSTSWKAAWDMYCRGFGGGKMDPHKHDEQYISGFFDQLGQCGMMALQQQQQQSWGMGGMGMGMGGMGKGMGGMGMGMGGGWGKGGGGWGKDGGPSKKARTGDSAKDKLIDRIKAFQRSGSDSKEAWWSYCDSSLNGIRDPAKHSADQLEEFCSGHGVP
eukprot:TRINITY_DN1140_c0_g1_i1.p1 TRINITY_DN1140_c0_g1~~TRINITY_DN1140_c0_g1_i1.p1  ORF type:complete len:238 (+),score=71.90 TRINITY_DN1140_c0_g1_i1:83-796(+)